MKPRNTWGEHGNSVEKRKKNVIIFAITQKHPPLHHSVTPAPRTSLVMPCDVKTYEVS